MAPAGCGQTLAFGIRAASSLPNPTVPKTWQTLRRAPRPPRSRCHVSTRCCHEFCHGSKNCIIASVNTPLSQDHVLNPNHRTQTNSHAAPRHGRRGLRTLVLERRHLSKRKSDQKRARPSPCPKTALVALSCFQEMLSRVLSRPENRYRRSVNTALSPDHVSNCPPPHTRHIPRTSTWRLRAAGIPWPLESDRGHPSQTQPCPKRSRPFAVPPDRPGHVVTFPRLHQKRFRITGAHQ
jgi:hypothetical protein